MARGAKSEPDKARAEASDAADGVPARAVTPARSADGDGSGSSNLPLLLLAGVAAIIVAIAGVSRLRQLGELPGPGAGGRR